MAGGLRLIYLHGIAGLPAPSPVLTALVDKGYEVVAPVLPGFDGRSGWEAPRDHLGWLTILWDVLDDTGGLPCAIVGASTGGMLAAELAALRPEVVTSLALLAPLGIWNDDHPGEDLFAVPTSARLPMLFAGDVPQAFTEAFADRDEAEVPVARYLAGMAAASLVWPLGDRGISDRLHRIRQPTLVVWGEEDRIAPVALAKVWARDEPVVAVPGAGHLVEWDAPEAVTEALVGFLAE